MEDNSRFLAIDKAIGKEGFKIILLLRLSPIFPFALSNYFYGVTAVGFTEYMAGTMLGFFPGTLAYVYGGTVRPDWLGGGREGGFYFLDVEAEKKDCICHQEALGCLHSPLLGLWHR